jgi:hypothetical protein
MTLETDQPTSSGQAQIKPATNTVPTKKGKEVMVRTKTIHPNTTNDSLEN